MKERMLAQLCELTGKDCRHVPVQNSSVLEKPFIRRKETCCSPNGMTKEM